MMRGRIVEEASGPIPAAPALLRNGTITDLRVITMLEWTPRWSRFKFTLIGSEGEARRSVQHYDSGRNEGGTSDRILGGEFDLLIDVGSAYGYYPCLLKSHHPDIPVVAIEADPTRYGCLLRNTMHYPDVDVVYGMVGSYDLHLNAPDKMCDIRVKRTPRIDRKFSIADLWSRYDLAIRPLIKVDVEGGESKILAESQDVMSDKRTRWIVESHSWDPEPTEFLLELFRKCGRQPLTGAAIGGQVNHIYVD